jgi:hypothetical protein
MKAELDWNLPLSYRLGAQQRLRGIDVFYDFAWSQYFRDGRAQFVHGQCLADQVIADCPNGKRAALLLTDQDDIEEGARNTDDSYVMVVNLPRYLQHAEGNAAAAYLVEGLGGGITRAKRFSERAEDQAEDLARQLGDRLDADVLNRWAHDNEDRLELLRAIGGAKEDGAEDAPVGDVERALAALQGLDGLDPEIAEAVAGLITADSDVAARVELLRALTEDGEGRLVASSVLHTRASERLADARSAADRFDQLLEEDSETQLQDFLESQPWVLGLDYAQIRPRQAVIRGTVDFLLERFDGFHDLLELKSPGDPIFDREGGETPVGSPSSYRLSRPLALALAQVHAYRHSLSHDGASEQLFGLSHSRDPRITILIGRESDLTDHEQRLLREFNRSLHHVEVMPFDVLGRRARATLDNVQRCLLVADTEVNDAALHEDAA